LPKSHATYPETPGNPPGRPTRIPRSLPGDLPADLPGYHPTYPERKKLPICRFWRFDFCSEIAAGRSGGSAPNCQNPTRPTRRLRVTIPGDLPGYHLTYPETPTWPTRRGRRAIKHPLGAQKPPCKSHGPSGTSTWPTRRGRRAIKHPLGAQKPPCKSHGPSGTLPCPLRVALPGHLPGDSHTTYPDTMSPTRIPRASTLGPVVTG
jgi:hypothetical protein